MGKNLAPARDFPKHSSKNLDVGGPSVFSPAWAPTSMEGESNLHDPTQVAVTCVPSASPCPRGPALCFSCALPALALAGHLSHAAHTWLSAAEALAQP